MTESDLYFDSNSYGDIICFVSTENKDLTNINWQADGIKRINVLGVLGKNLESFEGLPSYPLKMLGITYTPNLKSLNQIKFPESIEVLSINNPIPLIDDYSILEKMKVLRTICLTSSQQVVPMIPYLAKTKFEYFTIDKPSRITFIETRKIKYKYGIKLLTSFLIKKLINQLWEKFFYPTRFSYIAYYLN